MDEAKEIAKADPRINASSEDIRKLDNGVRDMVDNGAVVFRQSRDVSEFVGVLSDLSVPIVK